MTGIQNFLVFLDANWTSILICIGIIIGLVMKTINFFTKTKEEKIEIAKAQVTEAILKMISDAEVDYENWNKAGSIKRSQVIAEVYSKYPILSKVSDQESLINWIDGKIDDALKTLRQIISEQ